MSDTTPDELIAACDELGLQAQAARMLADEPPVVLVWQGTRYASVVFPRPNVASDGILWGHSFEHGVHRDMPAETLLQRVLESMPREPAGGDA